MHFLHVIEELHCDTRSTLFLVTFWYGLSAEKASRFQRCCQLFWVELLPSAQRRTRAAIYRWRNAPRQRVAISRQASDVLRPWLGASAAVGRVTARAEKGPRRRGSSGETRCRSTRRRQRAPERTNAQTYTVAHGNLATNHSTSSSDFSHGHIEGCNHAENIYSTCTLL